MNEVVDDDDNMGMDMGYGTKFNADNIADKMLTKELTNRARHRTRDIEQQRQLPAKELRHRTLGIMWHLARRRRQRSCKKRALHGCGGATTTTEAARRGRGWPLACGCGRSRAGCGRAAWMRGVGECCGASARMSEGEMNALHRRKVGAR